MKFKNLATSLTAATFLIVALTGVFMFFHIFDAYTKDMHEILGLAFVAGALLHLFVHIKGFKTYFKKPVFLGVSAAVTAVALTFALQVEPNAKNPKHAAIESVISAPLEHSLVLFDSDTDALKNKLKENGIYLDNATSLQDAAKKNEISVFSIISTMSS